MKKPGGVFDPDSLKRKIGEIEKQTAQADFWQDKEKAGEALSRLKSLKSTDPTFTATDTATHILTWTLTRTQTRPQTLSWL